MKTPKAIVGGYKVTWKYGVTQGGSIKVYIGIKDADNIRDGLYDLEHAIKFAIAISEGINDFNAIQLLRY